MRYKVLVLDNTQTVVFVDEADSIELAKELANSSKISKGFVEIWDMYTINEVECWRIH